MHPLYRVTRNKPLMALAALLATVTILLLAHGITRALLAPRNEWRELSTTGAPAPVPVPTAGAALPAPSASPVAKPEPEGDERATTIVNEATRKCMDDPRSRTEDGTELIIWDCDKDKANQRWTFTRRGELQVLGKCLDAARGALAPGTPAVIRDCTGRMSQRWFINADGTIVSFRSGLCVDVDGGNSENATPLRLETCSARPSQTWSRD